MVYHGDMFGPFCHKCGRVLPACICKGCGACNVHYIEDCTCHPEKKAKVVLWQLGYYIRGEGLDPLGFAKKCGLDPRTVHRALSYEKIRKTTAQVMAKTLHVTLEKLCAVEQPGQPPSRCSQRVGASGQGSCKASSSRTASRAF